MLNEEQLQTLKRSAMRGDSNSIRELREYNRILSKRANQRMLNLEKAGYDFYAYDIAITYVETTYDRERFPTSKKLLPDINALIKQIRVMHKFLSSKSSTISGQKAIERERLEEFRDLFDIPEGTAKEFLRFLGSDTVKHVFDITGISGEIYENMAKTVADAKNKRKELRRLKRLFDNYRKGELTYDELMYGIKRE